jgi:hypothetical protein
MDTFCYGMTPAQARKLGEMLTVAAHLAGTDGIVTLNNGWEPQDGTLYVDAVGEVMDNDHITGLEQIEPMV